MAGDSRAGINLNTIVAVVASLTLLGSGFAAFNSITNEQAKISTEIADSHDSWQRQFQEEATHVAALEQWRVTMDADLAIRREKNSTTLATIQKDISSIERAVDMISSVMTHPSKRGDIGGPGNYAGVVP